VSVFADRDASKPNPPCGRGLSQENLAVDAGIDRIYVSRLERGLENPTVGILDQLADALGVGIVEFFVVPSPGELPPKP
jgi:transcriptional regulator with XRE-family HTH domain